MLKRLFVAATAVALVGGPAVAQQPAAQPQPPREPPANSRTGVAVDFYVGDAAKSPARISHEVMFTQAILREGDPNRPTGPGAAMQYNKEIALATLMPLNATPLVQLPEQLVFYVQSGEGRLDDGKVEWDLKPGIAILIPPNLAHRFTNTGAAPLKMIMYARTNEPDTVARKDILVRDVNTMLMTERNVHWSNMAKYVFLGPDGLAPNDHVYIVYMGPRTIAGPHAHTPGQEELWVKITDGPALMQLGSEIRDWPINAGFVVPPNGQTVHAAINTSDEIQAWFYWSRLRLTPPERPAMPASPLIAEALERSTIAGRPIQATAEGRRGR